MKPPTPGEALDQVRAALQGSGDPNAVTDLRPALAVLADAVAEHARLKAAYVRVQDLCMANRGQMLTPTEIESALYERSPS